MRREKRLEDVVILVSNNDYFNVLLMLEKMGFTNMYVYVCMQKYTFHICEGDIKNALKALNNLEDDISRKVYGELLNRRVEYNHNHSIKMGDIYEGKMYFYNDLVNIRNVKVCVCIGIYAKEKLEKFVMSAITARAPIRMLIQILLKSMLRVIMVLKKSVH